MTAVPESQAAGRVASIIGQYLSPDWLTDRCLTTIASKVIANRVVIRSIFDELDADPKRLPDDRDVVLRQDTVQEVDDPTWWGEHVHHLRRELADAEAIYARVMAAHAPQLVDRDARSADEDSERISRERADEKADMPKGIAS